MKRQLRLKFEEAFSKKWVGTISERQKEAIRSALKEIMVAYCEMKHTCGPIDKKADEKRSIYA